MFQRFTLDRLAISTKVSVICESLLATNVHTVEGLSVFVRPIFRAACRLSLFSLQKRRTHIYEIADYRTRDFPFNIVHSACEGRHVRDNRGNGHVDLRAVGAGLRVLFLRHGSTDVAPDYSSVGRVAD